MGAPVCNINPKSPIPQSVAPALPAIPVAIDLATAIAALNAIRQWIIQYTNAGQGGAGGQNNQGGGGGTTPITPGSGNSANNSNFSENPSKRVTKTQRIYDPNDPSQQTYIDVDQIVGLQFSNKAGNTIKWSQGQQS